MSVKISFVVIWGVFFVVCLFGFNPDRADCPGFNIGVAHAEDKPDNPKKDARGSEVSPCPECPECPDPAKVILRGLEEKRVLIDQEKKDLEQEKKELERYEEQIDEKLESLRVLKEQIQKDFALLEESKSQRDIEKQAEYEEKIGRLVKMYAGMKPKNAAEIVNKMNLEVAQEIFLRMRETSASEILTYVDSEKAAKISERLAYKKN